MIEKKYTRYNREVVNRFINDYKLPIAINKEKYFFYFLELYDAKFNCINKWKMVWDIIDNKYDGDTTKFLEDFYAVRDKIITTVGESNEYKEFNKLDMNQYKVTDKPNVTKKNVYNCENVGKYFLSIDLKKANFQTLQKINKDIVHGAETYEEFVGKYTDLQYIKESKYFRQVVFGQLNPSRHITIESYYINEVWKVYKKHFSTDLNIVSMSNDEIVIQSDIADFVGADTLQCRINEIETLVKRELGLLVKAEYYKLGGYQLYSKESGSPRNTFFTKTNLVTGDIDMVCVPCAYYALVYKLFNNIPLEEFDYHFVYEGIDCRFMEEFDIRKV